MAIDKSFGALTTGREGPADHAVIVVPNDGTDLQYVARALLLNAAGTVRVTTRGGETVSLPLQAGYNPISVSRVHATGTAAGITIVALW